MSQFNLGQGLSTNISASQNAIGVASNTINTARNLKSALSTAFSTGNVGSAIRSINIPAGAEAVGDIMGAIASFGGDVNSDDWRVRLSLANWASFKSSPVLTPLHEAGGLIFPYTPSISISNSAKYSGVSTTHSNYAFQAYQNSTPDAITITAPMLVEDSSQALYWVAMVHYLRSLTKMFSGADSKSGNPPPIIYLNGYGNYVFKNVPVVVTRMSVELDANCDYIGCNVVGSMASEISGLADQFGGLASTIGGAINGLSGFTNAIESVSGIVGQVSGALGALGVGETVGGGVTHVPTKSSFSITLQPVYSRENVKKFSLDRFVTGGYINSSTGFV